MTDASQSELPERRHPNHGILLVDGEPTVIFDTVCTQARKPWLANDEVHELMKEVWLGADAWLMGRYVIMPNHIHFFAWYTRSITKYENWITYWKSQFSKKYKRPDCQWLTDHWDRRMRSQKNYEEKWNYVRHNPVRHELVAHPDEWKYQGEIYKLSWQ